MTRRIILATNNPHKLKQMRAVLEPLGFETSSPTEAGLRLEVEETGPTFAENARIKAEALAVDAHCRILADDSGLLIDVLGGEPGIYSARYGGEGLTDEQRVELVLDRMKGVPDERRTARYVSAIAIAEPRHETRIFEASTEGIIAREPVGSKGFGYDPIFLYPPAGRTFGEMDWEEKSEVSHRAKAMRKALAHLSYEL